jgi:hypothetical protein
MNLILKITVILLYTKLHRRFDLINLFDNAIESDVVPLFLSAIYINKIRRFQQKFRKAN